MGFCLTREFSQMSYFQDTFIIVLKAIPTLAIAGLGWWAVHYFTSRRDRRNAERIFRNNELKVAYQTLLRMGMLPSMMGRNSDGKVVSYHREFQDAISMIYLYGTPHQSILANKLCTKLARKEKADYTELVDNLREHIRSSLGLEPSPDKPVYLSITNIRDDINNRDISLF